ncbi:MAG TPA: GTPase Era, partial [Acidimicrobiales bacterium]|nr:GTPase Era [Acidimicrobiales bacterium]
MKIPNDESGIDDETITTASKNYRSGFISILGRPNVGKSSLVNKICGEKIAITSNKPQTTRHQIRGVLHNQNSQLIFVDTPGIHKPRTSLGERLNIKAVSALNNIDIMCLVLDATSPIGPGDRFIAEKLPAETIVLVNKCDKAKKSQIAERLIEASEFNFAEYFPVSARTGEGLEVLIEYLKKEIPEGPMFYPDGQTTDMSDRDYVAELV